MTKRPEVEPIRQPTLFQMEAAEPARPDRPFSLPNIFLGTSSFTASGWEGWVLDTQELEMLIAE